MWCLEQDSLCPEGVLNHCRSWLGVSRLSFVAVGCYLGTILTNKACELESIKPSIYTQVEDK